MIQSHVDIGGEDGNEQQNQSPSGCATERWKQEAQAAREFGDPTDEDEQARRRQGGWNDFRKEISLEEVQRSRADKQERQEEQGDPLEQARPLYVKRARASGRMKLVHECFLR